MQKATATYIAPVGDSKVVEMGGVTFFDGKEVELNSYDHGPLISKLEGNQYFDIKVGEDDKQSKPPAAKKRGRPSAADREAAKIAAEEADRAAKAAAEKAKAAKADLDATEKAAAGDQSTPARSQAAPAHQTTDFPAPKPAAAPQAKPEA
jgi:hypothetical protein